ncbi:MAG: ankyrin repeat domain-containing protein [Pseudomonadota bacterium]
MKIFARSPYLYLLLPLICLFSELSPTWADSRAASTKLFDAIQSNDSKKVNEQLDAGVNANAKNKEGQTPLHYAARFNDTMSARLLLKYKANVDGLNNIGETPLMIAAIQGHLEMVKLLHRYGAQINPATDWTPLSYAASGGFIPVIEYLIQNGADLDKRSINGISPLMMAIRQNQPDAALFLLNQGASATDQSADGRSIWQWATQHKQTTVLKKLKELHLEES